jgi:predicted HAD superfamily phosphohydrolase YqeG
MIITDMLAANFLTIDSILVQPIIPGDKVWNKMMTWLEINLFKKLQRNNLLTRSVNVENSIYNEEYDEL